MRPLATPQTTRAFLGGLRVMAVDGTVLDVPGSKANATGYSRSWMYELVWGYNRIGPETLGDQRRSRKQQTAFR